MREQRILRDPVREAFREAVRRKLLIGWYPWNAADGSQMFTVRPAVGPCIAYDLPGAEAYAAALRSLVAL